MGIISAIKITVEGTTQTFRDQSKAHNRARELSAANVIFGMELVDIEEKTEADKLRSYIQQQVAQLASVRSQLFDCNMALTKVTAKKKATQKKGKKDKP